MNREDEIELLTAVATPASSAPQSAVRNLGQHRTYTVMLCGLRVAMERRFPGAAGADTIHNFVLEMQSRFPDLPLLKPAAAEAIIWAAMGDNQRLKEVDPDDAVRLLFFITHTVMADEQLSDDGIDDYIERVLELAGRRQ